ncbi:MAG: Pyrimidine-nucleoside phosphorylase [bacterium]|nr:Pyrimidine-nucleoside phosphorylase [bacterium]
MAEWIDLIIRKREGEALEPEEISGFVEAVQREEVPVEQAAAFLMAVVIRGLDEQETTSFARAFLSSGQTLRFNEFTYPPIDLGETGGLGGKAAIIALPTAAVYGVKLPVVADRSLRHNGGLLDKFEAVPGFRTDLSLAEFQESVRSTGIAVIGQTMDLAPAEIRVNQLRANTGSLGGVSLTVAGLLARKAAAGTRGLVVEIACGSGGLAKNLAEAHSLADDLFAVGENLGIRIGGCITERDNPLGHAIGDSLEMQEAIAVLKGEGPADVKEVAVNLAASLLVIGQLVADHAQGRNLAQEAIADGRALAKLKEFVTNQGGDGQALDNPEQLPRGQGRRDVVTQRSGYLKAIDGAALGDSWLALGGSRIRRGDSTDHRVGLWVHKKIGDKVERGDTLVTLHTSEKSKVDAAIESAEEAFLISPEPADKRRLILENFGRVR